MLEEDRARSLGENPYRSMALASVEEEKKAQGKKCWVCGGEPLHKQKVASSVVEVKKPREPSTAYLIKQQNFAPFFFTSYAHPKLVIYCQGMPMVAQAKATSVYQYN